LPPTSQKQLGRGGGFSRNNAIAATLSSRGDNVMLTRRTLLHQLGAVSVGSCGTAAFARVAPRQVRQAKATEPAWREGISLFGDLKYPPGLPHFDYASPTAPIGGRARQSALGTYDNLNLAVAGVKGNLAFGIELIYDTLLLASLDEVTSAYGLLAEAVAYPVDFSWVRYRLRPEARWHDGTPVTTADVVFSSEAFKKYSPRFRSHYRHVSKAEITSEHEVTFIFDVPGNRELPGIVGLLPVLPRHWWEGSDAAGVRRSVSNTTLEPPLGSGPYRIKHFEPGRSIVYERVRDYWGGNLAVRRGCNNLSELRFDYFRDLSTAFEAFKAGDLDWHVEYSAKSWATGYDFPGVNKGNVVLEEFPIRNRGIMQAFAFNIRRDKFRDPRVRRAFNFAFDFEAINKEIFYGQYKRIASYFQTELACSGLPQGQELEILTTVQDKVPDEVFTTPYWNPVADSPREARKNLLHAMQLFGESGFSIKDMQLIDPATGEPMQMEFLLENQGFVPCTLSYKASLRRLGIDVTVRLVDPVQYENRLRQWDFDIVVGIWPESLSPGNEQRDFWGSRAADVPGSRNLIGIKNPAIDTLIDRVVFAGSRAELVAATKALDRVLLWNHYVIPQWTTEKMRTARWDRFGRPETMPKYGTAAFPTIWWWDAHRAAKLS
jgi:microcin C transport system substrate-binding protein